MNDVRSRFMSKVDTSGECWEWRGAIRPDGYGAFAIQPGKMTGAHRAAWIIENGDPSPLYVLHQCDNRRCVRFDHLYLGTLSQNAQDMDARGRRGRGWTFPARRGEQYQSAKLSNAQVTAIKAAVASGESQRSVARRFGVSHVHVGHLVTGKRRAGAPRR